MNRSRAEEIEMEDEETFKLGASKDVLEAMRELVALSQALASGPSS